ncbi:MAG: hypothetical protein ACI9C1_002861 [Candidatus Aldehydirespiratoraceae bacterium]|jgi:hypothetical protein
MTSIDPTVVIERMARRLRSEGAEHPVAGAIALAARGHLRLDLDSYANTVGLPVADVGAAEAGEIPFGDLHRSLGLQAGVLGADLLALADLEVTWRTDPPAQAARR